MKNLIVTVDENTSLVYPDRKTIGNEFENLQGYIIFKFKKQFINGIGWLEMKLPDGTAGFLNLTKENEEYKLPIKSSLLKNKGKIHMQLRITEEESSEGIPVFKSNIFYVEVKESLNTTEEIPDEYQSWLDVANEKLLEFEKAIEEVERLNIEAKDTETGVEITITDKKGIEKTVAINDGYTPKKGIDYFTEEEIEEIENEIKKEIPTKTSELINDSNFVSDENYVHTDNNYTLLDKLKLAELRNYNDTEIRKEISDLNDFAEQIDRDVTNVDNRVTVLNEELQEQETNISHLDDKKADKEEIPDISGLQEKLIAGENIQIEGNVISATGGGTGTSNYNDLSNKPKINNVELNGNKTLDDLNIQPKGNYVEKENFNVLAEKVAEIELFKFPNVIIHGEPTINNGQVSNFSNDNYLSFPAVFNLHDRGFEFNFAFRTGTDVNTAQNILGSNFCIALFIQNGKIRLRVSSNGSSWDLVDVEGSIDIQANTLYYMQIYFDKLTYKLKYSTDGIDYTDIASKVASVSPYAKQIYLGIGNNYHNPFGGMINLNKCNLKVNRSVIWSGMDDAGLSTRLATDLENIDEVGIEKIKDIAKEYVDSLNAEEVEY